MAPARTAPQRLIPSSARPPKPSGLAPRTATPRLSVVIVNYLHWDDTGRLVRQLLTETLALSCGGAAVGVALAVVGTRVVAQLETLSIPRIASVHVDPGALATTRVRMTPSNSTRRPSP